MKIPAAVFDTLELSTLIHNGIGKDTTYTPGDRERPCCIIGHGDFVGMQEALNTGEFNRNGVERRWVGWLFSPWRNDRAIRQSGKARLTWAEYCQARGITRGVQ